MIILCPDCQDKNGTHTKGSTTPTTCWTYGSLDLNQKQTYIFVCLTCRSAALFREGNPHPEFLFNIPIAIARQAAEQLETQKVDGVTMEAVELQRKTFLNKIYGLKDHVDPA